jgi:hypothetical protein
MMLYRTFAYRQRSSSIIEFSLWRLNLISPKRSAFLCYWNDTTDDEQKTKDSIMTHKTSPQSNIDKIKHFTFLIELTSSLFGHHHAEIVFNLTTFLLLSWPSSAAHSIKFKLCPTSDSETVTHKMVTCWLRRFYMCSQLWGFNIVSIYIKRNDILLGIIKKFVTALIIVVLIWSLCRMRNEIVSFSLALAIHIIFTVISSF